MGMKQIILSEAGIEAYRETRRREQFLVDMERVVAWTALVALIEPVCVEEALCDSVAMRQAVAVVTVAEARVIRARRAKRKSNGMPGRGGGEYMEN